MNMDANNKKRGIGVIDVGKNLDPDASIELLSEIHELFEKSTENIVVDLAGFSFSGSAGIGVFVDSWNEALKKNGKIVVISTNESVITLFGSMKFLKDIPLVNNISEALDAI